MGGGQIVFDNVSFFYKGQSERRPLGSSLRKGKSKTEQKYNTDAVPDLPDFPLPERDGGAGGIRSVSFCIPPGNTTVLVGSSGSGKTTIARLALKCTTLMKELYP